MMMCSMPDDRRPRRLVCCLGGLCARLREPCSLLARRRGERNAMTPLGWLQIALFTALIVAVIKPLGGYIAGVVEGQSRVPRPLVAIETGI
jgi:hypothetical protein